MPLNRVHAVVLTYRDTTSSSFAGIPGPEERALVAKWMMDNHPQPMMFPAGGGREKAAHAFTHTKAVWLQGRKCLTCDTWLGPGIPISFHVPISPFTVQDNEVDRLKNRKGQVADILRSQRMTAQCWAPSIPVCLRIIAVLGRNQKLIDVDNLTKGLMDAMQDLVFNNDRAVQHVEIQRLRGSSDAGYYLINASPVRSIMDDVVDSETPFQIV